ncbi:MAG: RidA family protein [Bdellovibrionales bacterium]
MKKVIQTDSAPQAVGPYSQAVMTESFLFCSGQISINPADQQVILGSVEEQTHQVMKNIEAVLKAADLSFKNIVKTTIFLTDMDDFATVNTVYSSYLTAPFPARSTVAVKGLPKGVNVEIEVTAARHI